MTGALQPTAGLSGLTLLRRASFSVIPGQQYANIAPPEFVIASVTAITKGVGQNPLVELQFNVSGHIPAWCKAGMAVTIAGSVGTVSLAGTYLVNSVDPAAGAFFTVVIPPSIAGSIGNAAVSWNAAALTGGAATLLVQFQKAIFSSPSTNTGTINISDGVDEGGAVHWFEAIAAGQSWEVDAPVGTKYDLKDWVLSSSNGTDAVNISFV